MKKTLFMFGLFLMTCAAFAGRAVPARIKLQGGNVSAVLRGTEGGWPVAVYWKDKQVLSNTMGLVITYAEKNGGFIGAGRRHGSFIEEPVSLQVTVDGIKTDWKGMQVLQGKVVECVKVSKLRDFTLTYTLRLENDKLSESLSYVPSKDVKLNRAYFLQPWNKRFTDCYTRSIKNEARNISLTHSKKYVLTGTSVILGLADAKEEIAAVIRFTPNKGKMPIRFLEDAWDAPWESLVVCNEPAEFKANAVLTMQASVNFIHAKTAAEAVAKSENQANAVPAEKTVK